MMLLTTAMLLLVVLGALYMFACTSPVFVVVGGMTASQQSDAEAWAVDLEWDLMAAEAVASPVLAEVDAEWTRIAATPVYKARRPMVDRPMRTTRTKRRQHGLEALVCNPYVSHYPALRGLGARRGLATPGAGAPSG